LKSNGFRGNFVDLENGDEYWVSGVKTRGSNVHWASSISCFVDDDAVTEYRKLESG